jgi:hypothetical protein
MPISVDIKKISEIFKEIIKHPMTHDFTICDEYYTVICLGEPIIKVPKSTNVDTQRCRLEYIVQKLDSRWVDTPPEYRFSEKFQWLSEKISNFHKVNKDELSTEDFNLLSRYEKKLIQLEEFTNGIN